MPLFYIKSVAKNGRLEEFNREYPDIESLKADLAAKGLLPAEIREKIKRRQIISRWLSLIQNSTSNGALRDEDIYNLFYELGIIMKAGVPIMRAFHMIIGETSREPARRFLERVSFQLKEGRNFSAILEDETPVYNFKPYIPVIRMGEKTGKLGESFLDIAAGIENWLRIRSEISNALIYPLILIGTSLIAIYIMLVYVIPRFQAVVQGFKVALPFFTRLLFSLSNFLSASQDIVLISAIALLGLTLFLARREPVKLFFRSFTHRIPIIRGMMFASENLHFLHALSNLLVGGVPILNALELASGSFSAPQHQLRLQQSIQSLRKGQSLAAALREADMFPEIIPNMIHVGEESGTLPQVLRELWRFMSDRFLKKVKRYMNLLEPLIIAAVALFIGLLIMTILPIIINISDVNF